MARKTTYVAIVTLTLACGLSYQAPASADKVEYSSQHVSGGPGETVVEEKGYAFKYGQRLKNWGEQLNTGVEKGWLTADSAQTLRTRMDQLRALNDSVKAKGYPRAELDDMEKQFTQFNIDVSHACETKPTTANAVEKKTETTTTK